MWDILERRRSGRVIALLESAATYALCRLDGRSYRQHSTQSWQIVAVHLTITRVTDCKQMLQDSSYLTVGRLRKCVLVCLSHSQRILFAKYNYISRVN